MAQTTLPAAANQFFKDTEKINKGIRELLDAEQRRAEELQRAIQTLKGQLDAAEASRLQVIELTNSTQKLLINSQAQLGGLVGAVESLLSGSGLPATTDEAPPAAAENGKTPEPAGAGRGPARS
jgi:flagellar motility protein MotE (MotC chaperone)